MLGKTIELYVGIYTEEFVIADERPTEQQDAKIFLLYVSVERLTPTTYDFKLKLWNDMFDGDISSDAIIDVSLKNVTSTRRRYYDASNTFHYSLGGNGTTDYDSSLYGVVFEHKLYEGILDTSIDRIARKKIAEYSGVYPDGDTVVWDELTNYDNITFNVTFGATSTWNEVKGHDVELRRVVMTQYDNLGNMINTIYSENITEAGLVTIRRNNYSLWTFYVETTFIDPFHFKVNGQTSTSDFTPDTDS